MSCKSFVEPQIIEICEKIHSQRDSKPIPGGFPPRTGFYVSRIPSGFSQRFRGFACSSSSGFGSEYSIRGIQMRRIRFRDVKKSKIQKCSESNSGRPKIWSKSGQNDPGTLIIGFALKNYAQKWSQIVKTLDGCPQNDDFGIFVRSSRTLL